MKAGTRYIISQHTGQTQRLQDYGWRILFLAKVSQSPSLYLSNYFTLESDPVFKMGVMQ